MMDLTLLTLDLFVTFFIIGMFTFGGGYAIISLIQSQIVVGKGWITESTFTDIVAISQMTPGPVGLNCSTYVGYEVLRAQGAGQIAATLGSFAASIALVLPSFLIMLAIVRFYTRFHEASLFKGTMSALKPAVTGLIGAAALVLMFSFSFKGGLGIHVDTENFADWKGWIIFAAATAVSVFTKAGPIAILLLGGLAGFLIY